MSGYSKMRQPFQLQKPKSMDSSSDSDLFYFSQPHKKNMKITPNEQEKPCYSEDGGDRKIDDAQLKSSGRGSFSMNSTHGFKLSRENSGRSERWSSAVKKVLPMRRSSSVSERYCRIIYDEFLEVDDEEGHVETETETTTTSKKKMKKMGNGVRILKACKRIFGF